MILFTKHCKIGKNEHILCKYFMPPLQDLYGLLGGYSPQFEKH